MRRKNSSTSEKSNLLYRLYNEIYRINFYIGFPSVEKHVHWSLNLWSINPYQDINHVEAPINETRKQKQWPKAVTN